MSVHLQREIDKLKKRILTLCAHVEENVRLAVKSFGSHDMQLSKKVINDDILIDQNEVDLEEECLKILALYQPVAIDLRYIIAMLKINNDLERIGDQAVNIAIRTNLLAAQPKVDIPQEFYTIAEKAQSMLSRSLDAFVNMEILTAQEVCASDDEVDIINRSMYNKIEEQIVRNPEDVDSLINILESIHQIERIADLATNIAEDVIYLAQGSIIRHGKKLAQYHQSKQDIQ